MHECVFGSMNPVVDDKIRMIYQMDYEPGLTLQGDEDMVDYNAVVYLEIDTAGLFSGPTSIVENNNIHKINDNKIFDILGREWQSSFVWTFQKEFTLLMAKNI